MFKRLYLLSGGIILILASLWVLNKPNASLFANSIESSNISKTSLETDSDLNKNKKSDIQSLKLMFAGDIMSQMPQIQSAHEGNGVYNFTPCFQYIKPIFETADLTIGNLECTLKYTGPYSGYPHFCSPEQLAEALKKGGIDILMTSNNHSLDSGLSGVYRTIDIVRKNGFIQTGTFKNALRKEVLYPLTVYKNGFKIAILNSTHHTNGFRTPAPSVVNRLDMAEMKKDLEKAKAMKPDFIITFLHWGDEHKLYEDANQREVAKLLHLWGSDLVVGAHPHVVQPIKNEAIIHNKKKYSFLTAYSLGNFISSQPFPNTDGGIVFEVDIKKQNNKTIITDFAYIPVVRYTPYESGKMRFYALPVSPFEGNEKTINMSPAEKAKMAYFAEKTRTRLNQFGVKEHTFALKDLRLDY